MTVFIVFDIGVVLVFALIVLISGIAAGDGIVQFIEKYSDTILSVYYIIFAVLAVITFIICICLTYKKTKINIIHIISYLLTAGFHFSSSIPLLFYFKEVFLYWDRMKESYWVFILFAIPLTAFLIGLIGVMLVAGFGIGVMAVIEDEWLEDVPNAPWKLPLLSGGVFLLFSLIVNLLSKLISTFWT